MKDTLKKLIDLPKDTAKGFLLLAAQENLPTKIYIEKVLVEYEQRVNHKKSANYKALHPKLKN